MDKESDKIIVIKQVTEEVKVSELSDREKAIYNFAYLEGYWKGTKALYYCLAIISIGLIVLSIKFYDKLT